MGCDNNLRNSNMKRRMKFVTLLLMRWLMGVSSHSASQPVNLKWSLEEFMKCYRYVIARRESFLFMGGNNKFCRVSEARCWFRSLIILILCQCDILIKERDWRRVNYLLETRIVTTHEDQKVRDWKGIRKELDWYSYPWWDFIMEMP